MYLNVQPPVNTHIWR